jgi:hypothetical protein
MDHHSAPALCHLLEQTVFFLAFCGSGFASGRPKPQVGQDRCASQTGHDHLQQVETRNKDRTPTGWVIKSWLDPLQTASFVGKPLE